MVKGFYFKMAWANVRRNRKVYLPYAFASSVIFGVFLLMAGLLFSQSVSNLPSGQTAAVVFSLGIGVFGIFALFFMTYINQFLVSRRKKEFGLYGILGLEKAHVLRMLIWENTITLVSDLLCGIVFALVLGRLMFLILLKLIHAAPESTFFLAPGAFIPLLILFGAVFVITSLSAGRQVGKCSPIELLRSERKGEKEARFILPAALLGFVLLGVAYYYAWTIQSSGVALGVFFLLVLLVIVATYLLMSSGSVVVLRLLKRNKKLYYSPDNFFAISGLVQRMKQNARSLATICILSTMLIVTVSGTLALYLGQEQMIRKTYAYDVCIYTKEETPQELLEDLDRAIVARGEAYGVTVSADKSKVVFGEIEDNMSTGNNYVNPGATWTELPNLICFNGGIRFDVNGREADCVAFVGSLGDLYRQLFGADAAFSFSEVFSARQEGYGLYGGLVFLGAFFGLLFLSVTVLIIYFKQITEGYEDKAQFEILQKIGMDDQRVRSLINRQVLWVFFIPLGMTLLHMLFASKIMACMLQVFKLYNWGLVLCCIGGVCLVFALLYLVVYKLTARVYYRIVKW